MARYGRELAGLYEIAESSDERIRVAPTEVRSRDIAASGCRLFAAHELEDPPPPLTRGPSSGSKEEMSKRISLVVTYNTETDLIVVDDDASSILFPKDRVGMTS